MVALPNGALVEALGWALIHSLWEFAVGGLAVGLVLALVPGRLARVRYALMMMVLVGMAALPVAAVSRALVRPEPAGSPVVMMVEPEASDPSPAAAAGATHVITARGTVPDAPVDYLPWLVAAYLAGAALCAGRLAAGYWRLRPMRLSGEEAGPELAGRVRCLAGRLGVRVRYGLRVTAAVGSPVVMGILRPLILLPAEAVATLAAESLDALLAHELAHLRRWDHVCNFVQMLIETLLFYHPAVWWISACIRQEREHCADDLAVRVVGDRRGYVAALEAMERLRPDTRLALAASGGNLLLRTRRLLATGERGGGAKRHVSGLSAACLVLGVVLMLVYAIGCRSTGRRPEKADLDALKHEHALAGRAQLRKALVTLEADRRPLVDVLQDIAHQAGVTMEMQWGELAKVSLTRETPVSVNLRNVSAEKALREVLSELGKPVGMNQEDRVLVVLTLADLQSRITVVERTVDIRDLIASVPVGGRKLELPSADGPVVEETPFVDSAATAEVVKKVIDTVKTIVAPDTWKPAGRGTIREVNGNLLVRQTEENQEAVVNLLNQLAETRAIKISLDTRILVVSEAQFRTVAPQAFALTMPAGATPAVTGAILDNDGLKGFLERLNGDKSVAQDMVPQVTAFNGYPVRFRFGALPKVAADEVGGEVLKRSRATIQSTASADRHYVVSQIKMDMPGGSAWTTTTPRPELTAGPETTTMVSIPDGGTLLMVLGQGKTKGGETRYVVQMLRPKIVQRREPTTRPGGNTQ